MSNNKLSESPRSCCPSLSEHSSALAELKLYQAFIFSVPVLFTFIILFLFYLFYLKRRRVDWSSLRMRSSLHHDMNDISMAELGLKKEVREMLPVIIYKETFSVRDTECSVCLGEYQPEEKLQQIPACGHTFHVECIDNWLANHTTCPLCRLSLVASAKASARTSDIHAETAHGPDTADGDNETSLHNDSQTIDGTQTNGDESTLENGTEEESKYKDSRTETDGQGHSADCAGSCRVCDIQLQVMKDPNGFQGIQDLWKCLCNL